MKMDGQIRVKTDERHSRIYNDLKNIVVGDFHELFFVCACLGYIRNKKKPLGKSHDDRFWSNTIVPREWACYYSILLKESNMNFSTIQDDKIAISIIEEYANAGMDILVNEFLHDYIIFSSGIPQLDTSCSKELPKNFLHYVFEQIDTETESVGL